MSLGLLTLSIIGLLAPALSASPVYAADELVPGPYLNERSKLKVRIEKLQADGVGIKPYQDALSAIEESVNAKEPDEQIQKSVGRLNSALDQQMQSKAAISSNSYYHVHGTAASSHSSAISSTGGIGGLPQIPKGVTPDMIQKLLQAHPEMKQKFEDYKKSGHL
jgi:hypothetical protein